MKGRDLILDGIQRPGDKRYEKEGQGVRGDHQVYIRVEINGAGIPGGKPEAEPPEQPHLIGYPEPADIAPGGYSDLCKNEHDPDILAYHSKIETISDTMYRLDEFVKTYQELGVHSPAWFRLADIIDLTMTNLVIVSDTCNDVEVFSDPMLERVFDNLFQNIPCGMEIM